MFLNGKQVFAGEKRPDPILGWLGRQANGWAANASLDLESPHSAWESPPSNGDLAKMKRAGS